MASSPAQLDVLEAAAASGELQSTSVENIRRWLTDPVYADYAPHVAALLDEGGFEKLNDVFWNVIPFGTGGRRGQMYEVGSAVINERTMGESAAGLASYVKAQAASGTNFSVAIAHDTRHNSERFAKLAAEIMVAAGFQVYFLAGYRSTPELSFTVRYKNCCCGIMITASHNPPSDNGFKAYWDTGGQILPPHDKGVIEQVMATETISRADFDEAVAQGKIELCQDEVDKAFLAAVAKQAFAGPRDLKLIYSPLHGVGASGVMPALATDGFEQVELFAPHAAPDGDFTNVPNHVSNPEIPLVFDGMIERAQASGAEFVMATDPDCDRVGCASPVTLDIAGPWEHFTGNQIGALMADYVLSRRQAAGELSERSYVVKTLVTTEMIRRIADKYQARTCGNLLVGFKWIGMTMDEEGPDDFVFGAEESHGYLVGQYARDKDGVVAAMLLAEVAAAAKAEGKSLREKLDALFAEHGVHAEHTVSVMMPGAEGMQAMQALMVRVREQPPSTIAGIPVAQVRDYLSQTVRQADGSTAKLDGPRGDMVIIDLAEEGNYVAIRPSGTEPKVKFYMFAYQPPQTDVAAGRQAMQQRLAALEEDLNQLARG